MAEQGRDLRRAQRRALWIALVVNAAYMVVEVAGGLLFNSLALLADAGHMLSDVVGLGIALASQSLMTRPASARHTYGLQRAEVLGALANGAALIAVVGLIFFEAARRLVRPELVAGEGLLGVAALGLFINVASALLIARHQGASLNMRAAFLHMASDAAGSVAVMVAGAAALLWGSTWVDPLASLLIGALILLSTWGLLRDTVHVLMEGAPRGMRAEDVERAIEAYADVQSVHHVHLWNLASDVPALSAHVVLRDEQSLHDAQARNDRIKTMLAERFGIDHATLELECHPCEPIPEVAMGRSGRERGAEA
jgi:cobalt-zinc-cadmium efflux system protein